MTTPEFYSDPTLDDETLIHESALICLKELCELDHPASILSLLESQGWTASSEVDGSDMVLQLIVRCDAVETFKAILAAGSDPLTGLSTRFWGGQVAVHHCAFSEISFGEESQSPRCLAYILELMPLAALVADENGRTALDWAAMASAPRAYDMLIDSLVSASANGLASHGACQKAAESAAFFAIAVLDDAPEAVRRAGRLAELGIDWLSIRRHGAQSLLGRALNPSSRSSRKSDLVARALLDAGIAPDSPHVAEMPSCDPRHGSDSKARQQSVVALMFGPDNRPRLSFPLTFGWMLERLPDDQFFAASDSLLPMDKKSFAEFEHAPHGMENAVLLFSRHAALAERLALAEATPAPANGSALRRAI